MARSRSPSSTTTSMAADARSTHDLTGVTKITVFVTITVDRLMFMFPRVAHRIAGTPSSGHRIPSRGRRRNVLQSRTKVLNTWYHLQQELPGVSSSPGITSTRGREEDVSRISANIRTCGCRKKQRSESLQYSGSMGLRDSSVWSRRNGNNMGSPERLSGSVHSIKRFRIVGAKRLLEFSPSPFIVED